MGRKPFASASINHFLITFFFYLRLTDNTMLDEKLDEEIDKNLNKTRHVFVKHGCPRRQQSQTMAKISKSYILTPPHPQGHVMSVKCEQALDELTVQVWLLYDHQNFKYCTLILSGTELRTDRRTDKQTDRQTDRRTDDPNTRCPRRTFQAGGIMCYDLWATHALVKAELQILHVF